MYKNYTTIRLWFALRDKVLFVDYSCIHEPKQNIFDFFFLARFVNDSEDTGDKPAVPGNPVQRRSLQLNVPLAVAHLIGLLNDDALSTYRCIKEV